MINLTFSDLLSGVGDDKDYPGFRGVVKAPNGFLYFIPYYARLILKVDPTNLQIMNPTPASMPSLSVAATSPTTGGPSGRWLSGSLAPNGKIYCGNNAGGGVLIINTNNDTFTRINHTLQIRSNALGNNGNIYYPPWAGNFAAKVNTSNDTLTVLPVNWNTTGPSWNNGVSRGAMYLRYWGAVPGPGNKIYGVPYGADRILIINTDTDTVTQGNDTVDAGFLSNSGIPLANYDAKWSGGTLSPHNNMIYCSPRYAKTILKIDTSDDSVTELPVDWPADIVQNEQTVSKYFSSVLGSDGRIYCVPWRISKMMIIDPKTSPETITFVDLPFGETPWYAGGVLNDDGKIIFAPWGNKRIAAISSDDFKQLDTNLILARWCNNTL
jgi:hypothetical protein